MPRNEQETDAVVDPVIAEMMLAWRLNLQLRMNIPPRATRLFFVSVAVRHSLVRTVLL